MLQPQNNNKWELCTEKELWSAFKQGNKRAFSTLFLRYYDILLNYGVKLIGNEEVAKDGIQKLFLRLWEKRENIADANSVKFYLLLSLRRILLRQKDSKLSREQRNQDYVNTRLESIGNIETKIIATELEEEKKELYQNALDDLTNRQREILFLRLHHGMKNEEIAELTGLTHQRVRNYMSEAIKRLKRYIFPAQFH
jgi:RNA polymerase sigma factor (sigma-70 family)